MTLIRTQINLEEEQYRLLTLEAQRQKRSLSDIVRKTINKQFFKLYKKRSSNALLELAKNAVDFKMINPNTPDDLVENMDEYLYGRKSKEWGYFRKKPQRNK